MDGEGDPLTNWPRGYLAALKDVAFSAKVAGIEGSCLSKLERVLENLASDGRVIEHELVNRRQRSELRDQNAQRSAQRSRAKPMKEPVNLAEI